jgi:hypothetical protein
MGIQYNINPAKEDIAAARKLLIETFGTLPTFDARSPKVTKIYELLVSAEHKLKTGK